MRSRTRIEFEHFDDHSLNVDGVVLFLGANSFFVARECGQRFLREFDGNFFDGFPGPPGVRRRNRIRERDVRFYVEDRSSVEEIDSGDVNACTFRVREIDTIEFYCGKSDRIRAVRRA